MTLCSLLSFDFCLEADRSTLAEQFLTDLKGKNALIAANPEKLALAAKDSDFSRWLNHSAVLYADGIGVSLAVMRQHGRWISRTPGCELWLDVLDCAVKLNMRVACYGGAAHVADALKERLSSKYPTASIDVCHGFFSDDEMSQRLSAFAPSVVFLGLGSPSQELFMSAQPTLTESTKFMGVGGSFDVFVGEVARAPVGFRLVGIEWLWRLMRQPSRFGRQLVLIRFAWVYIVRGRTFKTGH